MATYTTFASHILFKKILTDGLGSFYRAAEFGANGTTRTVWLRVFDGPGVPAADVVGSLELADGIAEKLKAANVAEDVSHPVENGIPGLAQKWVGGRPLNHVFEKVEHEGFPVPVDNALLILEKLALAVSAGLTVDVGGSALVHGFLHPGLILITNDGEAIVSGFGIAEQLLGVLDSPEAAKEAAPYLAPEVIMTRTTGKRGDIYSLGAILFQLLTGQPLPSDPATRETALDQAELAYDGEPIPDDIKGLIRKAISTRPEDRFSSAADFKKELDKLLYGGAYSPTTFNLALFMDRLFRSDIEEDEKDMAAEKDVDVQPYLRPEPEPEVEVDEAPTAAARPANRGLIYGALGLVAVVAVVIGVLLGQSGSPDPVATPTPTAEQIAAQKQAQEDRIKELAAQIAEEKLREKEEEITEELQASQERIDALQRQLQQAKKGTESSADAEQRQAEIQAQIEAEQEAQRQQQAQLEAERQKAAEAARLEAERQAEEQRQAEEEKQRLAEAAASAEESTGEPESGTEVAEAAPADQQPAVVVKENQYVRAEEVDTLPAILREEAVTWPRSALHSRRKGIVVVQATVNSKGLVDDVKILRADEEGFGIPQAVIEAVRQYRFKPGTKDGVNIKTTATVTKPYSFRNR
jgi:TonB family protein